MRGAVTAVLMGLFVMTASAGVAISGPGAGAPDGAPDLAIGDRIPDRYIVVLRDGVEPAGFARARGIRPDAIYSHALNGFAANIPAQAAQALSRNPSVAFVEPDSVMGIDATVTPTGIDRIDVDENTTAAIDGTAGNGANDVDIAVLDTGVDMDHPDLNVAGGANFSGSGWAIFWTCDNGDEFFDDGNDHGTHVAGTIAAIDDGTDITVGDNEYQVTGVVPGARIWGVKVLTDNGNGAISCIIDGVDWVTQQKLEANDSDSDPGIDFAVANMSLGGGNSAALCNAVFNSVAAGVVYAVAAGNSSQDAGNSSPANCSEAITVSAIADFDGEEGGLNDQTVTFSSCTEDTDDSFACFSNFGSTIEVAAPGVSILSTLNDGSYGYGSGTSMASPHVAGAVALYLLDGNSLSSTSGPAVISEMTGSGWTVAQNSVCGFTQDPDGDPEPLIYTGSSCHAPASPVTDIAVTDVSAPSSVVQGDVVSVDVTVANVGNQDVGTGINVTLTDDTDTADIGTQTISGGLNAGASTTLTFSWDTDSASLDDHTLTATHGFADDDATNNSNSTLVTVGSAVTDIAVTDVSAPASVVQGDVVTVDVTVANVGNQDVGTGINVTLTDDTDTADIGTQTISGGLNAGASSTLTFSWDTASASLGDHTLTASHDFADDDATNDSNNTVVTVDEPSTGGITLSATGYKVRGVHHADLAWSGATGTNVDVYRNGRLIATTGNDGFYTDNTGNRGPGSYTYQVCEGGTNTCSNETTVDFS